MQQRERKARGERQHVVEDRERRARIAAPEKGQRRQRRVEQRRCRGERKRRGEMCDGRIGVAACDGVPRREQHGRRRIRREPARSRVGESGRIPVALVEHQDVAEDRVRFGVAGFDAQSGECGTLRGNERLTGVRERIFAEVGVALCEADERRRVVRLFAQRLGEEVDRAMERLAVRASK